MSNERQKNEKTSQNIEARRQNQVSRNENWQSIGPFGLIRRFADEVDRMFGGVGLPGFGFPTMQYDNLIPHVDMFERDGKLVISADLPGLTKDDVKVDVTEEGVLIQGERKYEHEENEEGVYRSERSYGQFRRHIALPQGVKTDTATANFKNGVLEITMEAPQVAKNRRRLQIEGEDAGKKPGNKAA